MYRPTTALHRISQLKKPVRVIQGGQGAGKTVSIEMLIQNHCLHNKNKETTIIQAELSKLKKTAMRDFEKIMKSLGLWERHRWNKSDSIYTYPNGSYTEFIGLDKADVGKGFRRDLVYFNELNKGGITLDTFIQFQSRAKITYADFNPDRRFWLHDEIITDEDTDFIILTHKDNEYLPKSERKVILSYLEKGFFDPTLPQDELFREHNIKSKYWANKHKVYGLGLVGSLDGVILDNCKIIDRIPPNAKYIASGLDFGYSNDPTTIVDLYLHNNKRIWHESLYRSGMVNSDIARECNKEFKRLIYADSAEPKSIEEIRRFGVRILPCKKGKDSINFGLDLLQQEDNYITSSSTNLIKETESYTWDKDRDGNTINVPIDSFNHCIDPMRYVAIEKLNNNSGRYAIR